MGYYTGTYNRPRVGLGQAFWEYLDSLGMYGGIEALPTLAVPKKTASIPVISREALLRDATLVRAAGDNYNRDDFDVEDISYNCVEYGQEHQIDDGVRELFASDFDAEEAAMKICAQRLLREQDKRIAALLQNTNTFTGTALTTDNSGTPWSTAGTDIIGQVLDACEKVRQNTGLLPDAVIMNRVNLLYCAKNTAIKSAIQYTGIPTLEALTRALAGLFGVERVIVAGAVRNSAAEGATFTFANVWSSTYVHVLKRSTGSIVDPGLGRTLLWESDAPENENVQIYREEQTRSDVVRVRHHVHEKLFDPYFAHMIKVA